MNENEVWCLLWQSETNNVHVEPLERTLSNNRQAYRDDRKIAPWHPVYVGCRKSVEEAASAMNKTTDARRMKQPTNIII